MAEEQTTGMTALIHTFCDYRYDLSILDEEEVNYHYYNQCFNELKTYFQDNKLLLKLYHLVYSNCYRITQEIYSTFNHFSFVIYDNFEKNNYRYRDYTDQIESEMKNMSSEYIKDLVTMKMMNIFLKRKQRKEKKINSNKKIVGYLTYKVGIPLDIVRFEMYKYL